MPLSADPGEPLGTATAHTATAALPDSSPATTVVSSTLRLLMSRCLQCVSHVLCHSLLSGYSLTLLSLWCSQELVFLVTGSLRN